MADKAEPVFPQEQCPRCRVDAVLRGDGETGYMWKCPRYSMLFMTIGSAMDVANRLIDASKPNQEGR